MKRELNRRGFLKASAQGVAVAGLSGVAGHFSRAFPFEDTLKNPSAESITSFIQDYTADSPENSLKNEANEKAWDEPLVGFCRGDDPVYQEYKNHIGQFHWTPLEVFKLAFPEQNANAEELTIISWILPHTEAIKADLRKKTEEPSEKWIRARLYGEQFNEMLRKRLAENLTKAGYPAVVPILSPDFSYGQSELYGIASSWSERHAAYAAGLGTFGLCDGLITPKGKAIRCGSIVAKIEIPATPRPYEDHHAYCLHYSKGICGMCIDRCAGKAVSKSGHDKQACGKQCMNTSRYASEKLGLKSYGCGFCQTGVPCESRIPV